MTLHTSRRNCGVQMIHCDLVVGKPPFVQVPTDAAMAAAFAKLPCW